MKILDSLNRLHGRRSLLLTSLLLAASPSVRADQVELSSASGDGQMVIRGDQYGAFGQFSVTDVGYGNYNPEGAVGLRPWAYWSGMMLTDGLAWQWLMDADDWPGDFGSRMIDDDTISDETVGSKRTSSFFVPTFGDLKVDLVQEVSPYNVVQTYTFNNPGNTPLELKALWETDVDMEFAQGALDNLAGFVPDDENPRVYFIEESDVPGQGDPGVADRDRRLSVIAHPGENVELEGLMAFRTPVGSGGATHLHFYAQNMFGIEADYLNTVQEIIRGSGVPSGDIDGNGDNLMDEPGDVGGAMQFLVTVPASGSATLTLNFVGGKLSNAAIGGPNLPGDYNANGELDAADLDLQAIQLVAATPDLSYDLNQDGAVTFADRSAWVSQAKKTWIGDSNLDGVFDTTDFVAVFQEGKYEQDTVAGWAQGDWNGDLRFNSSDLITAFQDGGFEQGVRPAAVSAVPEPSSAWALLAALGAVATTWRRHRS